MYRQLHEAGNSGRVPGIDIMLLLSAAYVFGCAFRSLLPRADVQRICLFDTWLSSIVVGRSVATVAEVCFAAQWAMILLQLGKMTGAETAVNAAWVIVPLILIAECFSWYAVVTANYIFNAVENSLWAVAFFIAGVGLCRLLPDVNGAVRVVLTSLVAGIVVYLAFLMTVDVPMYLKRWRADMAMGNRGLRPLEGFSRRQHALDRHPRSFRMEGRNRLDVALFQRGSMGEPGALRVLRCRKPDRRITSRVFFIIFK